MRQTVRGLVGALTVLLLAFLLVLSALRFVEVDRPWVVGLTSLSAYALPGYVVVLVVCLLLIRSARHRRVPVLGVLLSLVMLVASGIWVSPYIGGSGLSAKDADLTVVSSNLEFGQGDPAAVLRASRGADLVVLQEVTPEALAGLEKAGMGKRFRHRAGRAVEGVRGTVVFSTLPLGKTSPVESGNGGFEVEVGGQKPFLLYAIHTTMLLTNPKAWHSDLDGLRARLDADVAEKRPVLAVGDWNATYSHKPMRQVLDTGMIDAAQESGTWHPTWPTRWRKPWLRPLFAIDHVLVSHRDFTAVSTSTAEVPHTDHLALRATLAFRDVPAAAGDRN